MINNQLINLLENNKSGVIIIKDDESNVTFDGKRFIDFKNLSIGKDK